MKKYIFLGFFLFFSLLAIAQSTRVVGYLPSYRFSVSHDIEYCKITHLNLSFANPSPTGSLIMPDITSVMEDAKRDNPDIIICISIAGGALSNQQINDWKKYIDIPANRPGFIANIVDYVLDNDLDGVDVDLEWGRVTSGYSDFVIELDAALTDQGKMLTVAFPNYTLFSNVSPAALRAFDFINIMSYDATGPWDPSNVGPHSSYDFSKKGVQFWKDNVGIAKERLTLGVPFYGFDFKTSSLVKSITFKNIVSKNVAFADRDKVGNIYYNGRPTIRKKVELAIDEVNGIMIWELGQDSFGEYSLLSTIHQKFTEEGYTTTGLCGNESTFVDNTPTKSGFKVYPNPASTYINIESFKGVKAISISNFLGEIVEYRSTHYAKNELVEINISHLDQGLYLINIIDLYGHSEIKKMIVVGN